MFKPHHIIKKLSNRSNNAPDPYEVFSASFLETLPYNTPYFYFDQRKIVNRLHEYQQFFPEAAIFYAMKANSEPAILKTIASQGCGFEVASLYELEMLKKIKVHPQKIIYGTSIKPAAHIKEFYQYGVRTFACDSLAELEKIASMAPGSNVYVRTIANDAGSVFKFSEKFGIDTAHITQLLLRAKELNLHPYGISFHVGSQASDSKAWANTLQNLSPILTELQMKGINLEVLNIGGGFPCQYSSSVDVPSLEEIAHYTLIQYKQLPYQPRLMLEPGRGIIADTGVLVVSIIARVQRKEHTWLFLDAGCYNALFETMAYQGSTRYSVTSMRLAGKDGESLFALAGPTGDSEDVIAREALLPADIDVGDKLIFHNIGAYTLTAASPFNGFPKPDVYYV